MNLTGKPDAVNLHVRFNEGDQSYNSGPYSTVRLLSLPPLANEAPLRHTRAFTPGRAPSPDQIARRREAAARTSQPETFIRSMNFCRAFTTFGAITKAQYGWFGLRA